MPFCRGLFYKGGFKSKNVEGFVNLPKNIPVNYLKFVHAVHDIDKTSILNLFDFTSLTYLQVVQKGFQDYYQKSYIVKAAMILFYILIH